MANREATARPGRDRDAQSGYTEGERPMPTEGEDRMESIYRNPVGAQSGMPLEGQREGGTRSSRPVRSSGHPHNTSQENAAYEGGLRSRVFDDPGKQGISSNSSAKESEGQRKVVDQRPDARAGLDHSSHSKSAA